MKDKQTPIEVVPPSEAHAELIRNLVQIHGMTGQPMDTDWRADPLYSLLRQVAYTALRVQEIVSHADEMERRINQQARIAQMLTVPDMDEATKLGAAWLNVIHHPLCPQYLQLEITPTFRRIVINQKWRGSGGDALGALENLYEYLESRINRHSPTQGDGL